MLPPQLQEQMEQQRQDQLAKISKKERIEKKLLKEEAIAVCYICNGGEHFENRSDLHDIVFCERCCVAVHASCYGFDAEEVRKEGGAEDEGSGCRGMGMCAFPACRSIAPWALVRVANHCCIIRDFA